MSTAVEIYNPDTFDTMTRAAKALAVSGYFQDAKDVAQAMVKVMAGRELGLGPFASMTGIAIIKGKPAIGANLVATLIKNDARYNYRVTEHSADACAIEFYEGGEVVGVSVFTMQDAKTAGLTSNQTWQKYPRNMLFARALTNGARWYTPGIFGGSPVYTPEELGADVDEDGTIVEGQFAEPTPPQATEDAAEAYVKATIANLDKPNAPSLDDINRRLGLPSNGKAAPQPEPAEPTVIDEYALAVILPLRDAVEAKPAADFTAIITKYVPRYNDNDFAAKAAAKMFADAIPGNATARANLAERIATYAHARDNGMEKNAAIRQALD